jgi:Uncharacterized conserved protein
MAEETVHEEQAPQKRRRIATFFRRLATRFGRGKTVAVDDDQSVAVDLPPEVDMAVEVEREDGNASLELEFEWDEQQGKINVETTTSNAHYELYEDNAGEYRWRLVHQNRNIIADSGEGYTSKQNAKQGLKSVTSNAPGAYIDDQSTDETVPDQGGSNATFELYEDNAEQWRWRLRHNNGNIISDSGQGYTSKQSAKQGLHSVQMNVSGAPVEEVE